MSMTFDSENRMTTTDADLPLKPRLTRSEAKARTRAALLSAAKNVFAREGYGGASLDQIAAEVGYTKGAVYTHFASKEDLFLELLSDGLFRQIEFLETLLEKARARPEQLNDLLNGLLDELDNPESEIGSGLAVLGVELQLESRRNLQLAAGFTDIVGRHREALQRLFAEVFRIKGTKPVMDLDTYSGTLIAVAEGLALSRAGGLQGRVASSRQVFNILLGLEPAVHDVRKKAP
ncbi:TetR family transcriptional regulator [Hyphomonas adhaerens MHS-3]|uniref:TetR family transcriptional regulator n=2 Tax=Hyphomonas adhaerens TaxID=81029 RepID=A0A069E3I4_9PROT|nr:TetR family transcriptional regulator [Hyphomonas adhaerens MHS-3]